METLSAKLLENRTLLDLYLLVEQFQIDWCILGGLGLTIGLCVARSLWYRSEKYIQQLQMERAALVIDLHEIEIDRLGKELEELKKEKTIAEQSVVGKNPEETHRPNPGPTPERDPAPKNEQVPLPPEIPIFGEGEDGSVYIMDVSRSLSDTQFENGKTQLIATLRKLEPSDRYQVIFFSGAAWFAHQQFVHGGGHHEDVEIRDRDTVMNWISGQASQLEFEEGNLNLPQGEWMVASPENIQSTVTSIESVERSYGTTWHLPFMMAMNLDPPPANIYFLTDNDSEKQNLNLTSAGIVGMIKRRAGATGTKVHTIAISPNQSNIGALSYIAEETGGKFSIVDRNNTVLDEGTGIREYLAEMVT